MDNLPLDIVDNIFKYMTLIEVVEYFAKNERFKDAASRQLAIRCAKVHTSDFIGWDMSTARTIIPHIGPYIREITINTPYSNDLEWAIFDNSPNIETVLNVDKCVTRMLPGPWWIPVGRHYVNMK